jgi:ketosteroid isomerase-like protein
VPDSHTRPNADVVRSIYAAFGRGDLPGVLSHLDEKVEWTLPDSLPFGGTYRGRDGVLKFFEKLPLHFPDLRLEPTEYTSSGDLVVVRGNHRGRGNVGPFTVPFAMFWTVRNGKAVKFDEYQDTAKTLKAI